MTSRERVLCALNRGTPDRVPYCEVGVDENIVCQLLDMPVPEGKLHEAGEYIQNSVDVEKALSRRLAKDNIIYQFRPPIPAIKAPGKDGFLFYGDGLVKSEGDLDLIRLPQLSEEFFMPVERFLAEKEDFAACAVCRLGISPTYLAMGTERFAIALIENPGFVDAVLGCYADWSAALMARISTMGFDFVWMADDIAFRTSTYLSPALLRDRILPRVKPVAEAITLPWVYHSDGNLLPVLDDLLSLGMCGLHPIEPEAMNIRTVKATYGDHLCLLGNVSINTLSAGTPEDVRAEVQALLRDIAPGGGYILTSANTLTSYCKVENILAMVETLTEFGKYACGVTEE